jgi:hypothetical protein
MKGTILQRIEAKIFYSPDGCWYWTASTNKQGYGLVGYATGKSRTVHRWMYEYHYKVSPGKLLVCHSCDNPMCVNPDHLFLGTAQDNVDDMMNKNRGNKPKGERNRHAKLSYDQIIEIRSITPNIFKHREIAKKYGVTRPTISSILRGATWKHIDNPDSL